MWQAALLEGLLTVVSKRCTYHTPARSQGLVTARPGVPLTAAAGAVPYPKNMVLFDPSVSAGSG